MKQRLLIFLMIILVFLFSCNRSQPSNHLDVKSHNEMLEKWKALNIKNYSFKYYFTTNISAYGPRNIQGYVKVKNGVGEVSFKKDRPGKATKGSYYYITSIEDAFNNVLNNYLMYKEKLDKKEISYLWYTESKYRKRYDEKYFFPKYIFYTYRPKGYKHVKGLVGGPQYGDSFEIEDFKVLKEND